MITRSDTLVSPWCGRATLWVCCGRAPPPMPMVSSERNDVREGPILNFVGAGVGAAFLRVLGTCQVVLLQITPGALEGVRVFNRRTGGLT